MSFKEQAGFSAVRVRLSIMPTTAGLRFRIDQREALTVLGAPIVTSDTVATTRHLTASQHAAFNTIHNTICGVPNFLAPHLQEVTLP